MPARSTPPGLRLLHGLPPREAPNTVGLTAAGAQLRPPAWLPREAKNEWRRIVDAVRDYPTWLQRADRAGLVAYCMAWSTFAEAAKDVAKRGPLVPGRSSADQARSDDPPLVKNPAVQVMRDASAQLQRWCRELGFTPDARGRVDLGGQDKGDDGDDPFGSGPAA